jgi:hypothetical protein
MTPERFSEILTRVDRAKYWAGVNFPRDSDPTVLLARSVVDELVMALTAFSQSSAPTTETLLQVYDEARERGLPSEEEEGSDHEGADAIAHEAGIKAVAEAVRSGFGVTFPCPRVSPLPTPSGRLFDESRRPKQ